MVANTVQSRKAKGRNFQKWIVSKILEAFDLLPDDVNSRSMGSAGVDVMLSPKAQESFPYAIEAKSVEKLNFWEAWKQANENKGELTPLLFVKRSRQSPIVLLDAEHFIALLKEIKTLREKI